MEGTRGEEEEEITVSPQEGKEATDKRVAPEGDQDEVSWQAHL